MLGEIILLGLIPLYLAKKIIKNLKKYNFKIKKIIS
tara:strand:+ start:83 stop:190 length:108 start_codon:yes stop_codon:yes gene_type:complete